MMLFRILDVLFSILLVCVTVLLASFCFFMFLDGEYFKGLAIGLGGSFFFVMTIDTIRDVLNK